MLYIRFSNIKGGFHNKANLLSLLVVAFYGVSSGSNGAFCSLRTPSDAIAKLFPTYRHHQTIVAKVTKSNRAELKKQLPFKFHFNEVGQHSLYLVSADESPLGFVHARSEMAPWGMMEIAWAFDWELTIKGATFQRCRAPICNDAFIKSFLSEIKGKNTPQLVQYWKKKYLTRSNSTLTNPTPSKEKSLEEMTKNRSNLKLLEKLMLQSAIKTIALTNISWKKKLTELKKNQLIKEGLLSNNKNENYQINPITTQASNLKNSTSLVQLISGSQVISNNQFTLGYFASTHWEADIYSGEALWVFDHNGILKQVSPQPYWPSDDIALAFTAMQGKSFISPESCANALELSAHELFQALLTDSFKS